MGKSKGMIYTPAECRVQTQRFPFLAFLGLALAISVPSLQRAFQSLARGSSARLNLETAHQNKFQSRCFDLHSIQQLVLLENNRK